MEAKKRKSARRFEQVNWLCDVILRTLPTTLHRLVLLIGWRHANEQGVFRKSTSELARFAGVSKRHMQNVLDSLIEIGALEVVKERQGSIPTSYRITGKKSEPTGEPYFTPEQELVANCSSASGEPQFR